MKSSGSWREWAEDFVDFIAMRDDELAEALNVSKESRIPIEPPVTAPNSHSGG